MAAFTPAIAARIRIIAVGVWGLLIITLFFRQAVFAQAVGASTIQGSVTDSSGAVIPGAAITVTSLETNLQRSVTSNSAGLYALPNLSPGKYRLQVSMAGFQTNVRELELVVGQQLVLRTALVVGEVTQELTVTAEAPVVNTSTSQVSGLVGEREVKDLPLNGRSFDNLITLNPGTVNTTSLKGPGILFSQPVGQAFSVAGRRPGETRFLWNGVEFTSGVTAGSGTPGGVSGQLLGIDAVREFNVMTNVDSAEYGHRPGGQVSVVTHSGSNSLHGSLFEFLRNSALDARNFFDQASIPPFKRNQFGGSAGGPIQKDKTFIFGNYEGFRQRLGLSTVSVVPDQLARTGQLPNTQGIYQPVPGYNPAVAPYFDLWPAPNGPELLVNGRPTGTALSYNNPLSPIREDFGIVRFDRTFSERDSLSVSFTKEDGDTTSAAGNPNSPVSATATAQVLSLTETHVFSPNVVNNFTTGYAHPTFDLLNGTTAQPTSFVTGRPMGQITVGGAGAGSGALTFAGTGPGTTQLQGENFHTFSYEDQVHMIGGIHTLTAGVWFQRIRQNETSNAFGTATFSDLSSFLQGKPTTVVLQPNIAQNPWRVWEGAWYLQDSMKLRPNLTVSLGLRHEFTNGFNNKYGKAANFVAGPDGVLLTQPRIGNSVLTQNNARWLFGPRAGLAWDPFGNDKTSVRAGFGIAYSLLDDISWSHRYGHPDFASYTITNSPFPFQYNPAVGFPAGASVAIGGQGGGAGIEEAAKTPTVINYHLDLERQVDSATSVRFAFIGSHGYHGIQRADANTAYPNICAAAQRNCPAGLAEGSKYYPTPTRRRNPALSSIVKTYTSAVSRYDGFAVDLNRHFRGGAAFRANYTFSRSTDNASQLQTAQSINSPGSTLDTYDRGRDYGLSAFDVRNRFSFSGSYELPFGVGKSFLNGAKDATEKLVSGWQFNLIVGLQSGFPFTAQLGFNQSRNGDTSNVDRPDMVPGKTLNGIYRRTPDRWFDPGAFALPLPGTYGNAGRDILIAPGLATWDISMFKRTALSERLNLQFRAEFFNLFNRANLGFPAGIVLTPSGAAASAAGRITSTATTSRQIQFGLKLNW